MPCLGGMGLHLHMAFRKPPAATSPSSLCIKRESMHPPSFDNAEGYVLREEKRVRKRFIEQFAGITGSLFQLLACAHSIHRCAMSPLSLILCI